MKQETNKQIFKLFDVEILSLSALIEHYNKMGHHSTSHKERIRKNYNKINELPHDEISNQLLQSLHKTYTDYLKV